jgi:hypothetical protein
MRNVFDQYTQDENRLTHALITTLKEDELLLVSFFKDFLKLPFVPSGVKLLEQRYPGEAETSEESDERKGIPDAWIYKADDWVLLIESKVQLAPTMNQLERHKKVAERRGFNEVSVLLLTIKKLDLPPPKWVTVKSWEDLYVWLQKKVAGSSWGKKLLEYMEVAERKMIERGYLEEGGLTKFAGIRFDEDNPYTYREGKRLLKLLKGELYSNKELFAELPLVTEEEAEERAITGSKDTVVWDAMTFKKFIRFPFNQAPHLTLVIANDMVRIQLNLPNKMNPSLKQILKDKGREQFTDALRVVASALNDIAIKNSGIPAVQVSQRRYKSQRSIPEIDGFMKFDLRTFFPSKKSKVKHQPEWFDAFICLVESKKTNINYDIGINFPYASCEPTKTPGLVNVIADTWIAMKPVIHFLIE